MKIAMLSFVALSTLGTSVLAADTVKAVPGEPFLVQDIRPGAQSSVPGYLMKLEDAVLFSAYGPVGGWSLWRSDGTESGTYSLHQVRVENPDGPFGVQIGEMLLFGAGNPTRELWRTDGTTAGTLMVSNDFWHFGGPRSFGKLGDVALFAAADTSGGRELFRSDGTEHGTRLVEVIGQQDLHGNPHGFVELNGKSIFVARHIVWGVEPFITDGTEAGTRLLKDINPFEVSPRTYAEHSYPQNLTRVGELVFFTADDEDHGRELWRTDGTTAGTEMVLDIRPGAEPSLDETPRVHLVPGGAGVFFIADDGVHGRELWTSDGTATGTYMVKDIAPGPSDGIHDLEIVYPASHIALAALDGRVFFAGDDGVHGAELWVSDGTEAGTVLVEDIQPGPAGSEPFRMFAAAGRLFFSADDGERGRNAWSSDGTELGTWSLGDLRPGDESSSPSRQQFVSLGNLVLFQAIDDEHGVELWAIEPPPLCRGRQATVYVDSTGIVHGGPLDGQGYAGVLQGSAGDDVIVGTDADDMIQAHSGNDYVCGGRGHDIIHGHFGNDVLDGGEGQNRLYGGPGDDDCIAGASHSSCWSYRARRARVNQRKVWLSPPSTPGPAR